MSAVRPVNRLLGFGIREITPSDAILSPLMFWMCIYQIHAISLPGGYTAVPSTHGVSCIELAAAHSSAIRICENMYSAHSEWSKMSVRVQDEMREGKKAKRSDAGDPSKQSNVLVVFWSILNTRKHVLGIPPNFSLAFVFLAPRRFTLFSHWACLSFKLALYSTYRAHDKG